MMYLITKISAEHACASEAEKMNGTWIMMEGQKDGNAAAIHGEGIKSPENGEKLNYF